VVLVGRLGVILAGVVMLAGCQRSTLGGGGAGGSSDSGDGESSTGSPGGSSSSSSSGSGSSSGATSSSSSSSSGSDSSTGDDGGAFIEEPDSSPNGHCEPTLQDCPNPDEKCTSYVTETGYCCVDANKCVPIIGDVGFGEPCTRGPDNDDCQKGLFCMTETSGSTGPGTCLAYCRYEGGDFTCEYGGECWVTGEGTFTICSQQCDPLAQDCNPGDGCYFVPVWEIPICARTDHPPGEGTDGDPCAAIQACEPGLLCLDGSLQSWCAADRCCTPACEVGNDATCTDPMESCVRVYPEGGEPPWVENLGYCGVG